MTVDDLMMMLADLGAEANAPVLISDALSGERRAVLDVMWDATEGVVLLELDGMIVRRHR